MLLIRIPGTGIPKVKSALFKTNINAAIATLSLQLAPCSQQWLSPTARQCNFTRPSSALPAHKLSEMIAAMEDRPTTVLTTSRPTQSYPKQRIHSILLLESARRVFLSHLPTG